MADPEDNLQVTQLAHHVNLSCVAPPLDSVRHVKGKMTFQVPMPPTVQEMLDNRAKRVIILLLVLLVAFGLRVFRLGNQPLWSDEIYSVAVARHSLSEVAGWICRDNHPALYWFVLYPTAQLLGDGALLVRFPSAFMGTLTVALAYAAGRQIFTSRGVGLFAALWLTASPIHVVYSQEARMYGLLTLFGTASTLFLHRSAFRGGVFNWALFGATAAATAHSHNYGLLLVAAQGVWGLGLISWKRESGLIRGAAVSAAIFAALYAPMIPALMTQMDMSVGSTGVASLDDIVDFFQAFGAGFSGFSTPGLTPGDLIRKTTLPSVAVTMALALLGLVTGGTKWHADASSSETPARSSALLPGICLVFPVAFVFGYSALGHKALWQVRGFQMALGCFALLVGAGLWSVRPRPLRWMLWLSLTAVAAINLYPHYFDRYKSTIPDAVAALEGRLSSEDILFVAPYWQWTPFRYYYRGHADAIGGWEQNGTFHLAGVGTDYADLIDSRSLEVQSEVSRPIIAPTEFAPDAYGRVWTIGHGATPQRVLELFGADAAVMHYDVKTREWYQLVGPPAMLQSDLPLSIEPSSLHWDNGLRLLGYQWQRSPVVGHEARLTLFWVSEKPQMHPLDCRLQMIDSSGEVALDHRTPMMSLMHSLPMTSLGIRSEFPATAWPAGSVVVQNMEFDVAPNVPPLSYRVDLQVLEGTGGEALDIARSATGSIDSVSVARPPEAYGVRAVAVQHRRDISFGGQITLTGYDLPEAPPRPGHPLPVWLHWVAERSPSADYQVQLRLLDGDGMPVAEMASPPSSTSFPTSMWKAGDLVRGQLHIHLPPDMEGGQYRLAARVAASESGEPLPGKRAWQLLSQEWVVLGPARIAPWPLITEAPTMERHVDGQFGEAVHLLGYDLKGQPTPGQGLTVTLYWQARTSLDASYSVFVHLVDGAGTLAAQADGIPANWLRPTTTWREGEIITDEHTLDLPAGLPEGVYQMHVGLYQPEGQRLPVLSGGELMPDGRLALGSLRVASNE